MTSRLILILPPLTKAILGRALLSGNEEGGVMSYWRMGVIQALVVWFVSSGARGGGVHVLIARFVVDRHVSSARMTRTSRFAHTIIQYQLSCFPDLTVWSMSPSLYAVDRNRAKRHTRGAGVCAEHRASSSPPSLPKVVSEKNQFAGCVPVAHVLAPAFSQESGEHNFPILIPGGA